MPSDYQKISGYNEGELGRDRKSRRAQVSMYADPTHFVYEILQNADDKGATEIDFAITSEQLVITHDATCFSEKDVEAISYFGDSQSREDLTKTGHFGVGFKSVFAHTAAPRISSGDESFEIYDLYSVREWPRPQGLGSDKTRIELPFNHFEEGPEYVEERDWKTPEQSYEKIEKRLKKELLPTTLLFTKSVQKITWNSEEESGSHTRSDEPFGEGRKSELRSGEERRKYLVFSRPIQWKGEAHKPIEIAFRMDEDGAKVQSLKPDERRVSVLFPTTADPRLNFILNGPFRTNPSRENIRTDDVFNKMLLDEASELLVNTLLEIRDLGLLDNQFIDLLPNSEDDLEAFYEPLKSATLEAFRANALVPAASKDKHLRVGEAVIGPSTLRGVVGPGELGFFLEEEDMNWTAGVRPNFRHKRFFEDLEVEVFDWDTLGSVLWNRFGQVDVDEPNRSWLEQRSDEWLKKFYVCLADEDPDHLLRRCKLMRASHSGKITHKEFEKVYFPRRGFSSFPQVPKGWSIQGSTKADKLRQALSHFGVREIGEGEALLKVLNRFYRSGASEKPKINQHLSHMKKFISGLKKRDLRPQDINNFHIFKTASGYKPPSNCYLDKPVKSTGLDDLFKHERCPESIRKFKLSSCYKGMDGIHDFCSNLGVTWRFLFEMRTIRYEHRDRIELGLYQGGRRSKYGIDEDFHFPDLDKLLSLENLEVNLLIWKATLQPTHYTSYWYRSYGWQPVKAVEKPQPYKARYRANRSDSLREGDATWVHELRNAKWIPDERGVLHRPSEIGEDDIHPSFRRKSNKLDKWDKERYFEAIQLGSDLRVEKERKHEREAQAEELGLDPELAEASSNFSTAEQKEWAKRMRAEQAEANLEKQTNEAGPAGRGGGKTPAFHEALRDEFSGPGGSQLDGYDVPGGGGASRNPERRRKKVRGDIEASKNEGGADGIGHSFRRVINWPKKSQEARETLRQWYGGKCQICDSTFKKKNGEAYFEGYYLIKQKSSDKWVDRPGNILCLCAEHCAMMHQGKWEYSGGDVVDTILEIQVEGEDAAPTPVIQLRLCEMDIKIEFAPNHIMDLQEMIKSSMKEPESDDSTD